jgi:hypothetical protein
MSLFNVKSLFLSQMSKEKGVAPIIVDLPLPTYLFTYLLTFYNILPIYFIYLPIVL